MALTEGGRKAATALFYGAAWTLILWWGGKPISDAITYAIVIMLAYHVVAVLDDIKHGVDRANAQLKLLHDEAVERRYGKDFMDADYPEDA